MPPTGTVAGNGRHNVPRTGTFIVHAEFPAAPADLCVILFVCDVFALRSHGSSLTGASVDRLLQMTTVLKVNGDGSGTINHQMVTRSGAGSNGCHVRRRPGGALIRCRNSRRAT
jgi:hypothetical protein